MKLFVPELGTELKLIEDWSFTLYPEYRNETLGEIFGYYIYQKWIKETVLPKMREYNFRVNYPPYPEYSIFSNNRKAYDEHEKACRKAEEDCVEYQTWKKDLAEYQKKIDELGEDVINATLVKGTILKVDRIYIRKGAKDFSSISFYITSKEKVKRTGKPIRFWAKLTDCNNIEFENV